jgi:ribosomal protein L11 methyltransferase
VAPGGWLVLSGVLDRQAEELIGAYAQVDRAVPLDVWATEDGWSCLSGRRRGPIAAG